MSLQRIGVLAGTFDPIHVGHIHFIEKTIHDKRLDKVFILIEKFPEHKKVFASYEDRLQMVELAIESFAGIEIFDCQAKNYPISACLPTLKMQYKHAAFYLMIGKDVAEHIDTWPDSKNLLDGVGLVVAEREDGITSGKIRESLKSGEISIDIDSAVRSYIKENNLYN